MFDTDAGKGLLKQPSVQIALCTLVFGFLGWKFWPFGTVFLAPAYAACIARPLMNLVANVRHTMRENVWLPLHGEHFVYKNTAIRVMEDESHWRWVCLDDVKKVIEFNASESALAAAYPRRFQRGGKPVKPYLRDDALIEHLAKSTNELTQRFRTWVDRSVQKPGATVRERLGVRDDRDEDD
jgi:hypothetical protein